MVATACISCNHPPIAAKNILSSTLLHPPQPTFSRQLTLAYQLSIRRLLLSVSFFAGRESCDWRRSRSLICCEIDGRSGGGRVGRASFPAVDDKLYEVLPGGKISYLDEQDVLTFLDPPKPLIPSDPSSFNPAAYLWKKIDDIPVERRHRLLSLLKPKLITRAWEIAGARYEDPKFAKKAASSFLSNQNNKKLLEFWKCRTSGGPLLIAWISSFKKALFRCEDQKIHGRVIGESVLGGIFSSLYPMYFMVTQLDEVMATGQPCDLAYEFGDGLLDLDVYPAGFPKPAKHPWPFNDQVVIYVRHLGPGVLVGQAWQEGEVLQQVPKKLCNEILMVKDFFAHGEVSK